MKKILELLLSIPWRIREGVFLLYLVLLTWLSLAPADSVNRYSFHFPYADKVIHFLVYGGLVLFARFAFPDPRHLRIKLWVVPLLALVYGALLDFLQGYLVRFHRSFEWSDIGANALGAIFFWYLASALLHDRTQSGVGKSPV